jgi:hypothetical protein
MSSKSKILRGATALFVLAMIAGCVQSQIQPVQSVVAQPPSFPPQTIMQTGDYAGFLKENSEVLKSCKDPDKCAEALFNLSFLYCYSKSPYYDPRKGLKYIDDLIAATPGSAWTFQARVWKDLIEKNMKKQTKKRPAREELKAKEAPESQELPQELPEEAAKPAETSQEKDWETDRQRLEDEIKSKDDTIKELNRQLQRSRQIDIEMEKKERGLLK